MRRSRHRTSFQELQTYMRDGFWHCLVHRFLTCVVLFSYLNMLMVSTLWSAGRGQDWEEADFRLEISHSTRPVYPYGDSQKKPGLDVHLWKRDLEKRGQIQEAFQAFIPFHNPLQRSNIKHFREIVVEDKKGNGQKEALTQPSVLNGRVSI